MSRAISVAAILYDIALVPDDALSDCALALTTTLSSYPNLAGLDSTFSVVMNALSSVMGLKSVLSSDLFIKVNEAFSSVSMGRQSNMAIGDESVVLSDNCRIKVTLSYAGDFNASTLAMPQTDVEAFTGKSPNYASVNVFGDSYDSVSVSITQFTQNPYVGTNLSSTTIKVQTYYYSTSSDNEVTVVLQNPAPIIYKYIPPERKNIQCNGATQPYLVRVNCTSGFVAHVPCPGNRTGNLIYTCPEVRGQPQCMLGNGIVLAASTKCRVIAYTSYNTTCKCRGSANANNTRRLSSVPVNPIVQEIGASVEIVANEFVKNWESAANLNSSTISKNYIIVATVASLLLLCILGLVGILREETLDNKNHPQSPEYDLPPNHPADHLHRILSSILPIELSDRPAIIRFWEKSLELHPYLAMFSPEKGKGKRRAKQWMLMTCEIVNMIFLNSILYYLVAGGGSVCSSYTSKEKCELPRNLDMTDSLCQWDASQNICNYNPPTSTFLAVLILTTLVTVFMLPLNMLCQYLINMSAVYVLQVQHFRMKSSRIVPESQANAEPGQDEQKILNDCKDLAQTQVTMAQLTEPSKRENEDHDPIRGASRPSEIFLLLKGNIDDVSADQEVVDLCDQWRRISGADILRGHTVYMTPEIQKFLRQLNARFGITRRMLDSVILQECASNPTSKLLSIFGHKEKNDSRALRNMVSRVRSQTTEQKDEVIRLNTTDKKQIFIMRAFISDLQAGQQKKIALKYLFNTNKDDDEIVENRLWKHTVCSIFLLMYILGTLFYIFLFGVSIGQHDTIIWLQVLGLSALQSIFIVKPLVIWVQFIATTSIVSIDLQDVLEVIKSNAAARAQGLEISQTNNVINNTNFIQNLNVGCRLARIFTDLPVSKILVNLRDVDLPDPDQRKEKSRPLMKVFGTLFLIFALFLIVMSQIPEGIQDLVFSIIFTMGTNCVLFSTFFLKEKTTVLPIIAVLLILGAIMIRQYIIMHNEVHLELLERRRKTFPTGTYLRGAMPRNSISTLRQRRAHTRKMFKETETEPSSSKLIAREKIRGIIREKKKTQNSALLQK